MNPRLVKFAVELQTDEKTQKKEKNISFNNCNKYFLNIFKASVATVPVGKN